MPKPAKAAVQFIVYAPIAVRSKVLRDQMHEHLVRPTISQTDFKTNKLRNVQPKGCPNICGVAQ